jgi:hypothetical protein
LVTILPWQRRARRSRGQALVEFALVLPLIAVLLVMSLDFGRVFFGWVGVNNAARIGANYAAAHADAWSLPDSPVKQAERLQYAQQLYNDASAVNCSPRPQMVPTPTYIPLPSFTDLTGNGASTDMGDEVTVRLSCVFGLLTPLANSILGGGVGIAGSTSFLVRSGAIEGLPTPGASPTGSATPTPSASPSASPTPSPSPCPLPIASFTAAPTSGNDPLTVQFTDTSFSGCGVLTKWAWDFGDGATSTLQNPTHQYVTPGHSTKTYQVKMTVTNSAGSSSNLNPIYITVNG